MWRHRILWALGSKTWRRLFEGTAMHKSAWFGVHSILLFTLTFFGYVPFIKTDNVSEYAICPSAYHSCSKQWATKYYLFIYNSEIINSKQRHAFRRGKCMAKRNNHIQYSFYKPKLFEIKSITKYSKWPIGYNLTNTWLCVGANEMI